MLVSQSWRSERPLQPPRGYFKMNIGLPSTYTLCLLIAFRFSLGFGSAEFGGQGGGLVLLQAPAGLVGEGEYKTVY